MAGPQNGTSSTGGRGHDANQPRTFEDILSKHTPAVRRIAERLREVVLAALPTAQEGIHGGAHMGMALYSLDSERNVVCGIQPGLDHCKLYLHRVTATDAPDQRLEGKGGSNRHIKFRDEAAVESAPIQSLLELSMARRG